MFFGTPLCHNGCYYYYALLMIIKKGIFSYNSAALTHRVLVTPYGTRDVGQHWFRYWLVTYSRQTIAWTNADILIIGPLVTQLSEILIRISWFSFKKCIWECSLIFCSGINVLKTFTELYSTTFQIALLWILIWMVMTLEGQIPWMCGFNST